MNRVMVNEETKFALHFPAIALRHEATKHTPVVQFYLYNVY